MSRFIQIVFFLFVGFLLSPSNTHACGANSSHQENKSVHQKSTKQKACCDTETEQCVKHGKACDGKCGNPACNCPTSQIMFTLPVFDYLSGIKTTDSKQKFYHLDTYWSSGFLFIWQPPKLG